MFHNLRREIFLYYNKKRYFDGINVTEENFFRTALLYIYFIFLKYREEKTLLLLFKLSNISKQNKNLLAKRRLAIDSIFFWS